MNRAINHLVLATVDSLTKFKNKLAYYLAIFAMVFGSTFGTMNAAYAVDQTATVQTAYAASAYTFTAATATSTLADATDTATSFVTTTGTDTAWGITAGTLTVTSTITTTANAALAVTLSGTGNLTIGGATVENATAGAITLALGGNTFTTTGAVTHVLAISGTGAVVVSGDTTFSDTIGTGTAVTSVTTAATKTTTFSEVVTATGAVTTTLDGEMTFAKNATAGSFSVGTGGSMSVLSANANTITGTIDGDATGKGTLIVNNTNAAEPIFANDIGGSNPLLLITGTTGATFNGNVSATSLTLANSKEIDLAKDLTVTTATLTGTASKLIFDGAVDQTITGTIVGAAAGNGLLVVNNTTGKIATFGGNTGSAAAPLLLHTVSAAKSSVFNGTMFSVGLTTGAAADVTIENNGNIIGTPSGTTGVLTLGANTILTLGKGVVDGETVFDVTTAGDGTNGVVISGDVVVNLPSSFNSGTVTLFEGTTDNLTAGVELLDILPNDTALTDYAAAHANTRTDVVITATAESASTVATNLGTNTNKASGLIAANASAGSSTDTVAIDAMTTVLNAATNTSAAALAEQVAPQTDTISGSAVATRAMTGTVQGIVSNRMASLRSGDAYVTGMSAGNGMSVNSGFIQAFGSEGEQKNTGPTTAKVYGYDSQTSGVAIGFDGMTETGETIGLSASFSTTDVDGKGTGKSKNAIDSYTVSVYADKATENGYIEGSLTYGINDNTSSRLVNTAGLSRTYAGVYDSEQISLKVGGGVPNEVKDGTFVTPFASATGTLITTDSYTETSTTASDALRLKIAQDDINSLVGTIGVKAHMITDKGTPMISFAINNEFGDTTINSTNTYTGGGTAFNTSTDVEELSATLGLGYSFGNDVSSVNIGYEANANEDDYLSHYGTVKIISKF
ncbi:autotransporter domain-containing protein [Candidatus Pelagibacter ubique]|nr:autotransporter domain-containing protein [Candidatus Pelagibacter ubique]